MLTYHVIQNSNAAYADMLLDVVIVSSLWIVQDEMTATYALEYGFDGFS